MSITLSTEQLSKKKSCQNKKKIKYSTPNLGKNVKIETEMKKEEEIKVENNKNIENKPTINQTCSSGRTPWGPTKDN